MEPRELLERLVAVVDTLGKLSAAVSGLDEDLVLSSGSLNGALGTFMSHLRDILGLSDVTSLGRILATRQSDSEIFWDRAARVACEWQISVARLWLGWFQLVNKVTKLREACWEAATGEDIAAKEDNMEDSEEDDREDALTASLRESAARRRRRDARAVRDALDPFWAACTQATAFPRELQRRLVEILKGMGEAFPNAPDALGAAVAEAERLWNASARLANEHLLGILEDILNETDAPGAPTVSERCQAVIGDIPQLLRGQ